MDREPLPQANRIASIDALRGLVMIVMALDHVRMYFAEGTWYAEPTNLAATTPLLFFTRWITHFCAPVFVFLAGSSAYLYGIREGDLRRTARFLLTRGLWLVFVELVIVNFAWTFDLTYSFRILQVIWAIGVNMVALSALVVLPKRVIFAIGMILVFGHNLLDSITAQGSSVTDVIWYVLHQPHTLLIGAGHIINIVYPVLPWIGLMALGYVFGGFYQQSFPVEGRRRRLLVLGLSATLLFILLRAFNSYGEPHEWQTQRAFVFSLMSFLNTTKYPPSLHFLLMTIGPALILLAALESPGNRLPRPILVFGRVPFFFYIIHLYLTHALALLMLIYSGRNWREYILSASELRSGALSAVGWSLPIVYAIWLIVVVLLYPLCKWYQDYRSTHLSQWWLSYL